MNDNRFLQKYENGEEEEEDECFREIEFIDDTPVISLEDALILYNNVLEFFPNWRELLILPSDARIESTRQQVVDQISKISSFLEIKRRRLRAMRKMRVPREDDFGFWEPPVPSPDELRESFPGSEFYRYLLEMELAGIKMDVRKTIQPILNLLSGSMEADSSSESLLVFKERLFSAMRSLGIYFEN